MFGITESQALNRSATIRGLSEHQAKAALSFVAKGDTVDAAIEKALALPKN